jgi:hypothetical protein
MAAKLPIDEIVQLMSFDVRHAVDAVQSHGWIVMPPTFGVDPRTVVAIMAGGPDAVHRAKESVEDDGAAEPSVPVRA